MVPDYTHLRELAEAGLRAHNSGSDLPEYYNSLRPDTVLALLDRLDALCAKVRSLQTAYLYADECAKRCQANGERDAARVEVLETKVRELRAERAKHRDAITAALNSLDHLGLTKACPCLVEKLEASLSAKDIQ